MTEPEIQQRFLKAFNQLLADRKFIISDTKEIMKRLLSTDELQSKAEELREEMVAVSELSRQNIEQNASMALDQDEFQQRDQSLSERFQRVSDQLHEVEAEYAKRTQKRREFRQIASNPVKGASFLENPPS